MQGLTALATAIGSEQCLQAIEHERQTELFTEWGHRWIDLKRTNRADAVLSMVKNSWHHNDQLYLPSIYGIGNGAQPGAKSRLQIENYGKNKRRIMPSVSI